MTQTSNTPGPAAVYGGGAGCHECGQPSTTVVRVGRYKVGNCGQHAEVIERTIRRTLAVVRSTDAKLRSGELRRAADVLTGI